MDPTVLDSIAGDELELCGCLGAVILPADMAPGRYQHAPLAVLPMKMSEGAYHEVVSDGLLFGELYYRISRDFAFLEASLGGMEDQFITRQLSMAREVLASGFSSPVEFSVTRSDYMMGHRPDGSSHFLQIEYNTISCSFPSLSDKISEIHSLVVDKYRSFLPAEFSRAHAHRNSSVPELARAFHDVFLRYPDVRNPAIVFVVQKPERNIADQKALEAYLELHYHVPVLRKTLGELDCEGRLDAEGNLEVGEWTAVIAYYRAGYTPRDYPSESEWSGRLKLERSRCVKCPNIFMHLSGSKKIQQLLAEPGVTERFLGEEKARKVREYYAGLWSLSDSSRVSEALANPSVYVLKPQREGGGNNFYGEEMHRLLSPLSAEAASSYILMERIIPQPRHGYLLMDAKVKESDDIISEFGVFYCQISSGGTLEQNQSLGYLLRTKRSVTDEGGVATGFAVLDSIAFD